MDLSLETFLLIGFAMLFGGGIAVVLGLVFTKKIASKPKQHSDWLTRHQLETLEVIRKDGRSGIPLWHTDINLTTIHSLAKRGLVDSRSHFDVVITRAGKARLRQPWPSVRPTRNQEDVETTPGEDQ